MFYILSGDLRSGVVASARDGVSVQNEPSIRFFMLLVTISTHTRSLLLILFYLQMQKWRKVEYDARAY